MLGVVDLAEGAEIVARVGRAKRMRQPLTAVHPEQEHLPVGARVADRDERHSIT
jgi:hypothetical protein